ncbi:TPA: hypothetical protein KAK57_000273 [Escherichia coli]|uniref:Uncharacterized protein n=1 Tax=Escherichia coli MS 85-1 TaxID=679202 RepID=A0AAN3SE91_ECOLX|nr:hypothetical protein [Escherichia coli]AGC88193.1 hypothetical protein APECO78_17360 [Escherichia coli APEC O78]AKP85590.1 hypothetical protein J444_2904 [Escherichia coli ACN001]EEZ5746148.1 hypothetical protein [Escherichia coli O25]EEZ5987331.1 hypothetical protein [Escherichia coli O78]EEZ9742407.1 hypothetical protein [Escherichia coli O157]EEZ9862186.1 hypothetical protein [Escherichia coli O8]EFT0993654.1 hypothetical protein [Shigella sonnei]EFU34509.1 hypothetical protein HMPREF
MRITGKTWEQTVFPAPAGINRRTAGEAGGWRSVPRASGDKPVYRPAEALADPCSPRQRG